MTCSAIDEFSEGLAALLVKRRYGYIDTKGAIVITPQFAQATRFHEGLAAVEVFNAGDAKMDYSRPQQFGYVNRQGTMAIPATFRFANPFSEGLAAVKPSDGNGIGYIDESGTIAIAPIACDFAGPFIGGLARVQGPGGSSIGYIDRSGNIIWPMRS